jgi:hypothetical protein
MSKLNQIQKDSLKSITTVENYNELKKMFKNINKEIVGLTDDQIYCLDNTVYTDSTRKKLIKLFREENLICNLQQSIN